MTKYNLDNKSLEMVKEAVSALYFRDSSDYEAALWKIVTLALGNVEEIDRQLYLEFNPE